MNCRQYITETKVFTQAGSTASNTNAIIFINTGTAVCTVANLELQPGQQLAISGNRDEMDITTYYFTFGTIGVPALTVLYKKLL